MMMRNLTITLVPAVMLLAAPTLGTAGPEGMKQAHDPVAGKTIPQVVHEMDPAAHDYETVPSYTRGEGFHHDPSAAIDEEMEHAPGVPVKSRAEASLLSADRDDEGQKEEHL